MLCPGLGRYLIVSIPDLCILTYFQRHEMLNWYSVVVILCSPATQKWVILENNEDPDNSSENVVRVLTQIFFFHVCKKIYTDS